MPAHLQLESLVHLADHQSNFRLIASPLWTPALLAQYGHEMVDLPTMDSVAPYIVELIEDGKYPGGTVARPSDGLHVIAEEQEGIARRHDEVLSKASVPVDEILGLERRQSRMEQ